MHRREPLRTRWTWATRRHCGQTPIARKAIVAEVGEHMTAGADHVVLMPTADDFTAGLAQLEELAPALAEISR
jgi:hypothetical protein